MDLIVIGGGCYGKLHATRLLGARHRKQVHFDHLLVVDRNADPLARRAVGERDDVRYVEADWDAFLAAHLDDPAHADDLIVPAPLAPHLFLTWIERALARTHQVQREKVTHTFEQPYARHGADGGFYFSYAAWECPVSCTEPATCPAIRAPRTWEQSDFLETLRPQVSGLATFVCRQYAAGIGVVPVRELLHARDQFTAAPLPATFLVATVSACHGALGQLRVEAAGRLTCH